MSSCQVAAMCCHGTVYGGRSCALAHAALLHIHCSTVIYSRTRSSHETDWINNHPHKYINL
jgi:hypothetical protein